ncbi:hypothetical protein Syun_005896 [Stephania yunnanensis]|uniref:Uncharacterized protein n=1 Tax=Stephania yunnanensis TaxID=152371 RepID=A0AAP0KY72_9MAGN
MDSGDGINYKYHVNKLLGEVTTGLAHADTDALYETSAAFQASCRQRVTWEQLHSYPKEDKEQKIILFACRNCGHQTTSDFLCNLVFKLSLWRIPELLVSRSRCATRSGRSLVHADTDALCEISAAFQASCRQRVTWEVLVGLGAQLHLSET